MSFRKPFTKILFESPSIQSGEEQEIKKSDFEFEKKLGDGAFGHVWKVSHRQTKQTYALKQVAKEKVIKMQSQFKREVFIMYNLNHPHIAKLFNHFEDEKSFYLVLEYAECGNLFHRLHKQKQFMECEAAQYFREVLSAVSYLHSHTPAIIHRDIKPENILLDKNGRVKLTDFGWSNYCGDELEPRMTICGTPEYLPPEMVEHRTHDTSADIWCLGVLLYEMLVGHTPFKSQAKKNMLINISMCKPKFPLSFPPLARDLISKMLLKSTGERLRVSEIMEHAWLKSVKEINEVKIKYSNIVLPQYHDSIPVEFKYYKVIGEKKEAQENKSTNMTTEVKSGKGSSAVSGYSLSDSDVSLSFSESIKGLEEVAYRESLRNLADGIDENQVMIKVNKGKIRDFDGEIKEKMEKVRTLELGVREKLDGLVRIQNNEKTLKSKIEDLDLELEDLFLFKDSDEYKGKIIEMKLKVTELNSTCEGVKLNIENLKKQIKTTEEKIENKAKELKNLNEVLESSKSEVKKINVHKVESCQIVCQGSLFSLDICEEIKKRTNETISKVITSDEAEELLGNIKNSLRSVNVKNNLYENKIIELKRNFEENKYNHLVETKMKKEKIVSAIKENNEKLFAKFYEISGFKKNNLREELRLAREFEHKYAFSYNEYDKIVNEYITLKNLRNKVYNDIKKKRSNHFELREKKRKKINQIKSLEKELNKLI